MSPSSIKDTSLFTLSLTEAERLCLTALLEFAGDEAPNSSVAARLYDRLTASTTLDNETAALRADHLSSHFTLAEMTRSVTGARKGLDNTPPPQIVDQLILTADRMEKVRSLLGDNPIRITSGYRSPAVNKAVGGSATSAHRTGHAVDFTCPAFGTPAQVAAHLAKHLTGYDQLIEEFGDWVHIGFGPGQRMQKLTARKVNGKTVYSQGIKG